MRRDSQRTPRFAIVVQHFTCVFSTWLTRTTCVLCRPSGDSCQRDWLSMDSFLSACTENSTAIHRFELNWVFRRWAKCNEMFFIWAIHAVSGNLDSSEYHFFQPNSSSSSRTQLSILVIVQPQPLWGWNFMLGELFCWDVWGQFYRSRRELKVRSFSSS